MSEDAGTVYASIQLKIDDLKKGIVDAQKKVNDFSKKVTGDTSRAGANIGHGLKSGFDVAGRGAMMFGKMIAMSFGPVMIIITLVSAAIGAIKEAFGRAAKDTVGFSDSVATLSSFFQDKLLVAIKPIVVIIASLTKAITDFITSTTETQRFAGKIIEAQNKLLNEQKEELKKIAEEETKGLITSQEANSKRAEIYGKTVDGMISDERKLQDNYLATVAAIDAKVEKARDAYEKTGKWSDYAGDGAQKLAQIEQDAEKEKQDALAETEKQKAIARKNLDEQMRLMKEAEALAEAQAKAKQKRDEEEARRLAALKALQEQINAVNIENEKTKRMQSIMDDDALTAQDKQVALYVENGLIIDKLQKQREAVETTQEEKDKIDELIKATNDLTQTRIAGVKAQKDSSTQMKLTAKDYIQIAGAASNAIISIFDTMAEVNRKKIEEQIALIDEMLERQTEAIEEARQRELEEAGFAEVQRAEDMQAQIDAAKESGDQILQYQLQRKQQEKRINEKYDAQQKAAEEKAAKEKADLEYKMAMEDWKLNIIKAINNMAMAISTTLATTPYPFNIPLAALSGAAGAVQIAALQGNPPKPPKYETGGIVPGSSYTGDRVPALVNSGELILNRAQQGAIAGQLEGGAPIQITLIAQLDGREITRVVAETAGSGIVTIPLRGIG